MAYLGVTWYIMVAKFLVQKQIGVSEIGLKFISSDHVTMNSDDIVDCSWLRIGTISYRTAST